MDFDINFLHHHGKKCSPLSGWNGSLEYRSAGPGLAERSELGDNLHGPEEMLRNCPSGRWNSDEESGSNYRGNCTDCGYILETELTRCVEG